MSENKQTYDTFTRPQHRYIHTAEITDTYFQDIRFMLMLMALLDEIGRVQGGTQQHY